MKRDALPGLGDSAVSPAALAGVATGWPRALTTLGVVLAAIVAAYFGTAAGMVAIWERSETFAHGFVVAPISFWLIWRMRARLAPIAPRPSWVPIPFMAAAGFAWLVGEVGAVNALTQFAFVAMLVLAVPAVLGLRVARTMIFPLGFLFFSVPFGEFLLPTLMLHTADFTIAAVRASGVPVLREGLQVFSVPNGRWSVIEACSGVRYLIASIVVGTLFAYLNYRTWSRKLAFVAVSIVVPIAANWIRAYMIVMLGYLSNNKIATGIDHIIYGWIFFGVVMLIMFWVGSYWRQPDAAPTAATVELGPLPRRHAEESALSGARAWSTPLEWVALVVLLAAIIVWPLVESSIERSAVDATATIAAIDVPGWQASPSAADAFTPHFENPSAVRQETLTSGDRSIGLFIAYYRGQGAGHKLISSENVLLHARNEYWHAEREGVAVADLEKVPTRVRSTVIRGAGGQTIEAWLFYWIDGHLTASDAVAKARVAWLRVTGRYDGSAVIVAYSPVGSGVDAPTALNDFLRTGWPAISSALVRAKEAR